MKNWPSLCLLSIDKYHAFLGNFWHLKYPCFPWHTWKNVNVYWKAKLVKEKGAKIQWPTKCSTRPLLVHLSAWINRLAVSVLCFLGCLGVHRVKSVKIIIYPWVSFEITRSFKDGFFLIERIRWNALLRRQIGNLGSDNSTGGNMDLYFYLLLFAMIKTWQEMFSKPSGLKPYLTKAKDVTQVINSRRTYGKISRRGSSPSQNPKLILHRCFEEYGNEMH